MDSLNSKAPIIIDIGTSTIKAGFGGQEKPSLIFPNIFGEMKYPKAGGLIKKDEKREIIGKECLKYMGVINIKYPLEHGIFKEAEDIEVLLDYIYTNLDINMAEIKEHPVLIAEPLLSPKENRQNIAKFLFDTHKIEYLFFASQPVLSLYSTSSASGAVLESGDGVTQSCIIYDGYLIPGSNKRINLGGKDVTEYLQFLLNKKGYGLNNSDGFHITKKIKEEIGEVSVDKNISNNKDINKKYMLPDDNEIDVGEERFLAPEILFNPMLKEYEYPGLPEILSESINKVNVDLKKQLYNSILLCGGNMKMKGMKERIHKELKKNAPKNIKVRLHTPSTPENSAWIGANIISSLDISKDMWISRKEWFETDASIINTRTI
jgi:centractin